MEMLSTTVHDESVIIDGLFCHLERPINPTAETPDLMLDHIQKSGVTAFSHSLIADSFPVEMPEALTHLYDAALMIDSMSHRMMQIRTVDDLLTAKRDGKIGVIFSTQGLNCVGNDLRNVWILASLGVRIMQLTYNEHNALGSGCMEKNDQGLTRSGEQVIDTMKRCGVVLDLSHVGRRTTLDALSYAKDPVIFSHVGVRAFNTHPRNIDDEQIRAVAETGGVVGLCPHSIFVERERGVRPTIDDFIDQITYVAELVGIDHVGIGTDNFSHDNFYSELGRRSFEQVFPTFFAGYGPTEKHVIGFNDWPDWPNLTDNLLRRGFSEEDVKKILGGNFMKVFGQVWK